MVNDVIYRVLILSRATPPPLKQRLMETLMAQQGPVPNPGLHCIQQLFNGFAQIGLRLGCCNSIHTFTLYVV